ncbi:MAG: MBL fold metallo-hydrolase [Thaumarchaeota archaeon]|nr:MBL fold metallo-hydrolase [Nitrososphaerota archaeon]
MTVSITCYGGVNQIGGNKILVQDGDTKVLLDFGSGFSDGSDYFSSNIEPRNVNGAGDYFEFGLLPQLTGLYSEQALQNTTMKHSAPEIDAILLSHYHFDHMGRINLTDPEIPVHCGETTSLIHSAYSDSGDSPLDGHKVKTFRTGDKFRVGAIEVEPVHVDHSIPGAYGFILHTSAGTLAYTGDFRFHGPMGSMTDDFIERAAAASPAILVTEGTRVKEGDPKAEIGEREVAERASRLLSKSKRLAFSSFRGNDLDRVASFHEACQTNGRRLVVSMKVAILLDKLAEDKHLKLPRVGKDVSVYVRRKKKGTYDDSDYFAWERRFLDSGMTASQIRENEKDVLLHLDQWCLPELIDIRPEKGGTYIHATTEAFNEEGEQDEQVIRNWVEHYGFSYHQIHASGHAPMERVRDLVNRVGAKRVVPVHTERADLFSSLTKCRVTLPRKGTAITIA